jgi:hypothetical protein
MNYTNYVVKQDVERNFIKNLENLEQNIDKVQLAITDDLNYLTKNSYQLIANLMTANDKVGKIFFNELINTCFQIELKSQESSYYFIKAFISFAKEFVKNQDRNYSSLVESNKANSAQYLTEILKTCKPASREEVDELIEKICNDSVTATIVKEATNLAGIEGNIVVEETENQNSIVELQFGYNFSVNSFKGFIPSFGTWMRSNVKVLFVDGLIEKVSELDKILSKSFETKIPLMVMAQGFSEEVIATFYTNNSRGNFEVMPVRLEQSLESLNVLNDIAVVCGSDIVSSLKGESLALVDYGQLPTVEKISLTNDVLTINNSSTRGSVIAHLNYLKNRRNEQSYNSSVSDLADLTTKRIQNLLSHMVKISLPKTQAKKIKVKIDNCLRACRTIYTYGFCNPRQIDVQNLSTEWQKAHRYMINDLNTSLPSTSLYLAASFASNLATSYFTTSGGIIIEE